MFVQKTQLEFLFPFKKDIFWEREWERVLEKESAWAYLLCAFVIVSKNDLHVLLRQIILDLFVILKWSKSCIKWSSIL